jgi:hypothetical protein
VNNAQTFRARGGYIFAGVGALLSLLALWSGFSLGGIKNFITAIFWVAAALTFLYLSFIKPKIQIGDEGIIVTNPVLMAQIGWVDVIDLNAKWNMYIRTRDGSIQVWAAPAPNRRHSRKLHASEVRGMKSANFELISPAHSPRSESGIALHLAESAWGEFQKRSDQRTLAYEITRDWRGVILLGALVIIALGMTLIN